MHDALGDGRWERPKLRLPSEHTVPEHGAMNDCEIDHDPPDIGRGKHVMRYVRKADFGMPESAFLLCRFCLTDAWWQLHRRTDAIGMFNDLRQHRNHCGLLAADIHLKTSEVYQNLHRTWPMARLKPTAVRSQSWEVRYWLD
jgi:hypothetical protein